jgi:branched-chain amino acid transport system ATP-binding protein
MSTTAGRLEVHGVSKAFGGVRALANVSLLVPERSIVGVIGPNGAGKTTLFNVVTGVVTPDAGEVRFEGRSLDGLAPARIAASGIARTFQNVRLFAGLSVLENVVVAGEARGGASPWHGLRVGRTDQAREVRGRAMLDAFDLLGFEDELPSSLSHGDQRRLEMARALMTEPRALLLDEPAAGLNATEAAALARRIRALPGEWGLSVLLVEHNVELVLGVCDHVVVLDHGVVLAQGAPDEVRRDPRVIAAYLGEEPPTDSRKGPGDADDAPDETAP